MKTRAAAALWAALMLAFVAFTGAATAGGNGHGGGGDGHGDHATAQQSTNQQQTSSSDQSSSGDNSTGVKPSNSTQHDTHANASSDKTKQYGNGQTAGQIATKSGYGNADLHGPGNSQPHKVNCGGHEVDVHALKNKSCGAAQGAGHEEQKPAPTPEVQKPAPTPEEQKPVQKPEEHKVTICHATGSATNPYVEITVDEHALKNGHTTAKGDIIPAPASGCPAAAAVTPPPAQVLGTATQTQNCTTTKTESDQVVVGVKHFIGPKGSGRYVIIHPSPNSSHYRDKHPDELIYQTVTKTVTVPGEDCTAQATAAATAQATATPQASAGATPQAPATQATAPASSSSTTPSAAGSVLGATAPLNATAGTTAKPKAHGGVLGTIAPLGHSVGAATLPFTGLPLWLFALVAAGLIGVGLLARRAGAQR